MAFFQLGIKKEEREATCVCGVARENVQGIQSIKVLGAGCKSCHQQYENIKEAVAKLNLSVEVEYITDLEKVAAYGVMSMPAIVVNEKVASVGKVLKQTDVEKLIQNHSN